MGELVIYENEMNKLQLGNLSKTSMNIFMTLCYKMKKQGDKRVVIDFAEVKELSGYKRNGGGRKDFISDLDRMTDQLLAVNSKHITKKPSGKQRIYKFDLFPTFIIDEETQTLEVGVNPDFQWLLNEFEHYTSLDLEEIVSFKSKYSKNLYRLLRQWKSVGKLVVGEGGQEPSIEDFRKKIGVKDSYSTKEMLRSCIDVAVREINASECVQDLKYEKTYASRRGRPLAQIIFTWKKESGGKAGQKKLEDITEDSRYYTVKVALENNPEFKEADIENIAKAAKMNGVSDVEIKQRICYVLKRENLRNPTGYIISLMRKFNDVVEIRSAANSFNEFEQNEYDFDELERVLLGEYDEDEDVPQEHVEKLSDAVETLTSKKRKSSGTVGNAVKYDDYGEKLVKPYVGPPVELFENEIMVDREKMMAERLKAIIEIMKNNTEDSLQ